jgi:hypothetical protein
VSDDPRTDFFASGTDSTSDDSGQDARTAFFGSSDDSTPSALKSAVSEPVYDASEFKRRVGRDPEGNELAVFKQRKGEGFASGNGGGSLTGLGEAALATGASALKGISHAANDILPDWGGSKASVESELNTDPILNYRGGPEAQQYLQGVKTLMTPVTWAANKAHQGIASVFGDRAADVAGDIATLVPAARGTVNVPKVWNKVVQSVDDPEGEALPNASTSGTPPSVNPSERGNMGAAQVNPSPFQLTGQETGRGSPFFPQVKLAKNAGDVAEDEQHTRAGIVKEILNDSGEKDAGIRTGVLTGNEQTLRDEYLAAKKPDQSPANDLMAQQIGAEQRALPKFAQQRIDATGADPTLTNDYQRGETINNAFYGEGGLKDYLNQQKSKIYQQALEKNGDTQIPIDITEAMLKDPQFTAGSKLMKHESVVGGAQDLLNLAKTVGFKDPITGAQYAPGSVAAYQAVTKALNKGWTPDNAVTIGKINEAINQDIAKSGSSELYQLGNKIHKLDKGLLSDSAGIKDVFGEVDPNGIQTGKDFDNIPKILNNMPLDQWRHIHDTLDSLSRGQLRDAPAGMDSVPPELQQAATRAKAEMHGALAREVYSQGASDAGEWNPNKANKTLNGRVGQKILDSLPPDEIRKFQVLNAAGHIMPGKHPYEGAGLQTSRLSGEPGFIENYAAKAGILAGAKTGIPGAALVGEKVGAKVSGLTKASREAKQAANVSQTLRDNLNRDTDQRAGRASGGKVNHDALVERLIQRWKSAKKSTDKITEPLLKMPDAAIVRALEISQEHI